MFNRIRVSLTAWYVSILLLIVALVAAVSYVSFSRSLASEVDDSLESSAKNVASQLDDDAIRNLGQRDGSGEDEDHHEDDDGGLRFFLPAGGDTFYLVLGTDGSLLANPVNVRFEGLPDAQAAERAAATGASWSNLEAGGEEFRLYSLAVQHDGETMAVVQVGRSLAEHRRQLTGLLLALAVAGGVGLFLAAIGGLLVAGRALRPIRTSFERQRAFVADASHELRTPLTIIRGNAEMLELSAASRLAPEDRLALNDITGQAAYMEHLIRDLSLLARLDQAQLPLEVETLDVAGLLEDVRRAALALGSEKGIQVEVSVPPGMTVYGDRVRLRELLMALLDNAVRYTPARGRITITAQERPSPAISIADSGPGIDPAILDRIFDRFYRGDESRSRAGGGTGLGLSIAQAIALAHGARITARNAPEGGAVFTLELPAGRAVHLPARA